MKQAKRAMAALALAATLAAGGAAVAIAGPTVAGAAEAAATGTVSRIGNVLSGLVSDGTITQTQADAVQKALDAANSRYGRRAVGFGLAAGGDEAEWRMKREKLSPSWTTRWEDVPKVKA